MIMGGDNYQHDKETANLANAMTTPPNLLPFDIERAKAGAKVVTRIYEPVTINATDLRGDKPLLITVHRTKSDDSYRVHPNGKLSIDYDRPEDLFIHPEVKYEDFTIDTVQLGAWYRRKGDHDAFSVCSVETTGVYLSGHGFTSYETLRRRYEYTLSPTLSNAQWHECRREVRE